MAKVTGPFYSIDASGTLGKAMTAAKWKGINYMRKWFIPSNPQTAKQVNLRLALSLSVAHYQTLDAPKKLAWDTAAVGMKMSGFNLYLKHAQLAYIAQLGVTKVPLSVTYTGTPPDETFVWVEDV